MKVKKDYGAIMGDYVTSVLDGSQLVCRTVRHTIDRHLTDLQRSQTDPDYPYYFDTIPGSKICRLFELVRPSKWPTRMVMGPWMVACTLILYGWRHKDTKLRRFRQAFLMWPRKSGKSAYLSVLSLNAFIADDEMGPEVYSAALTEEQARRVFDESVAMVEGTPQLREKITKVGDQPCKRLTSPAVPNSVFRPLSRDKETMEGLHIHFAACDEVHKWTDRGKWDVIRYGMRARRQPLLVAITTAPSAEDTTSICNTLLNYSIKILEGVIQDDTFFSWITSIDTEVKDADGNIIQEADAWDDETKWVKACPNLGISFKLADMRQEALEAKNQPESLNAFQRYSLNMRVDALDQPITTSDWKACARPGNPIELRAETLETYKKRICFAALDLAIIGDTSALVVVFPPMTPEEKWRILPHFWIPTDNILTRVERDRVPYDLWRDQGFLYTTPGKTTDFEWISDRILEIDKLYDLRELAYDPALASGLIKLLLTKGFKKDKVIKYAQTAMNYAAPCGDFTRTVMRRELEHDGDPVLQWHITNLRWAKNYTGLIMPDKIKSTEKIDGATAAIMGYGRATHPDNAKLLKPKPKASML